MGVTDHFLKKTTYTVYIQILTLEPAYVPALPALCWIGPMVEGVVTGIILISTPVVLAC